MASFFAYVAFVALLPARFARLTHSFCVLAGASKYNLVEVTQKTLCTSECHSGSGDVASRE